MASLLPVNSAYNFPDESVSPQKKVKPEWLIAYAQAALDGAKSLREGSIGISSRELYRNRRAYAFGKQDTKIYSDRTGIDDANLINNGNVLRLVRHYSNIGIGILEKQGYKVQIDTIDPQASMELTVAQADRKARLLLRQSLQNSGMPELANHYQVAQLPGEADDLEGLEITAMGERHPICADAQDIWRAVANQNKFEVVRRTYCTSLFYDGAAVVKTDTEHDGITIRNCPLGDMVVPYCKYPDFSDLTYVGELRTIPVVALAAMSCGQIKKSDLEALYSQGNPNEWYSGCDAHDDIRGWWSKAKIQVLDLEILSTDTTRREEYRNAEGNLRYREVVLKKDGTEKSVEGSRKVDVTIQNIYRVKWVVGTDIIFDYGKQVNMMRDSKRPARARFSYHIKAGDIDEMQPFSRMDALIPLSDNIETARIKLQDTLNRVIGSGYEIDLDKIEDVNLGTGGGEAMSAKDVLNMWVRNRILVKRGKSINGQFTDKTPAISFIQGGLGNEIGEFRTEIFENVALIKQTVGLNDVTDASTPNAKNLNSTNAAMVQGTNNALSDLFFADKQIAEQTCESVIIRAQDMCRPDANGHSRGDELAALVGRDSVRRMMNAPPLDRYSFGIKAEDNPSPEEWEDFRMALLDAVKLNQITVADRFAATNMAKENLPKAQEFIAYCVRKSAKKQQDDALQMQQANAQTQIQSAQEAEKAKQGTLKEEYRLRGELSAQEHEQKMEEIGGSGGITLEKERIGGTARIVSATRQADGRDASNIRDNTSKLIKDGHGDKIDAINTPANLSSKVEPLTDEQHPQLPKPAFSFLSPVSQPEQPAPSMPEESAETPGMDAQEAEAPQMVV